MTLLQQHSNQKKKKTMRTDYLGLIFISLLPLASGTVTSSHIPTDVTSSSSNPHSEISPHSSTQSIHSNVNPEENQTATTTNSIPSQLNSLTAGLTTTTVLTSTTTVVTSSTRNQTTTKGTPSMLSSTKIQDTEKTSKSVSDKITFSSTHPTLSTNLISTTASTKYVQKESTSASPVTGGDVTSTGFYTTSMATLKTPFIHVTTERENTLEKNTKSKTGTNPSKVVAGLIGGALTAMMVGFLVIYLKKRKLQRQQITTTDWAGPSPFLEGGADNAQVTLRSSNRISLSSFLPQRLSKRLSLLPETEEELQDMASGTTFGDKHQEGIFGQNVDGNVKKSKKTAAVNPELKSTEHTSENVENAVSVPSLQTSDLLSVNNNVEVTNLIEDHPANPPTPSGIVENGAFSQQNEGLGKP